MIGNIINCPDCKKNLIGEEEYSHQCIFRVIEIPITYFYIAPDDNNVIVAKGINGKFYRLVKSTTPKSTHQNNTPEGNNAQSRALLILSVLL